jgi:signal peptidase II
LQLVARSILVSILLLGCVSCDQATKGIARAYLVPGDAHSYLHDTIRLVLARNPGAFLSIGETLPATVRSGVFIVGVGLLTLGSLLAALLARGLNRWQIAAFALIASGCLGNLTDRLTHGGGVTDFLNVGLGNLRTGIFNVADMVLMVGMAVLCFVGLPGRTVATDP